MERLNWNVVMAVLAVLFLALVICPLLLIGRYDFTSCGDFSYGSETYKAFLEMKSFFFVLKSALEKVKEIYGSWQGTYSAIFLMTLNPAVWGDEVYGLLRLQFVQLSLVARFSGCRIRWKHFSGLMVLRTIRYFIL